MCGSGDAFADQCEELDDLAVDAVEALGDFVRATDMQCEAAGHRPTVPRPPPWIARRSETLRWPGGTVGAVLREPGVSSEVVRLDGHVVHSLLLAKGLDTIVDTGARYEILELDMGTTSLDPSHVRIRVDAADDAALDTLLSDVQVHGVNREDVSEPNSNGRPAGD